MSQTKLCRLCVKVSTDYVSLYNEAGQKNNICERALKYFDPMFLNADHVPGSAVLCLECCGHISVFHNFQQEVFQAQRRLHEGEKEIEFEFKKKVGEELILDNSHVAVKQDDSNSLPDLELVEEFMFTDSLKNEVNRVNSQTVIEPIPQRENTEEEEEDTEQSKDQPLSSNDTSESKKGSDSEDNQPSTTIKPIRKQNADEPIPTFENAEEFGDKITIDNFDTEQSKDQPISTSDTSEKGSDSDGNQPTTTIKPKHRRSQRSAPKDLDAVIAQRKPSLECVICKESLTNFKSLSEHFRLEHPNEPIPTCENTEDFGDKDYTVIINNFDTEQSKDQPVSTSDTSESEKGSDSDYIHPKTTMKRKRKRKQRSVPKDLDAVIAQWKPSLECVVCKKSEENFLSLSLHFRNEHPNERCRVECCSRRFYRRCTLVEHARLHFNPDKVKCNLCDSYFVSINWMHVHMRRAHFTVNIEDKIDKFKLRSKSSIECVICKTSFAEFSLLKSHYRQDHPTEVCYVLCCERKFYWPYLFEEHMRLHRDPNAFKCEICGKKLCGSYVFKEHMQLHCDPNAFKCGICGKRLCRSEALRQHMLLHRDPNAFNCQICGKRLSRSDSLREHMRLHREPNAFKCEICGKRLCSSPGLKRHIRLCHFNIKTADP